MRKMKLGAIIIIVLLLFFGACTTTSEYVQPNPDAVYTLTVLHTNDTHGHPLSFNNYPADDQGGMPARATFINKMREEYENVLVLDAGDFNTGMPESNFFKAEPDILGMNYMKYDALTLGNHEFDNDVNVLKKQMGMAEFPFLSANVTTKGGKYLGKPYIIKNFNGFKVAIFGLTTNETVTIGNPSIVKDLNFLDEVEVAKKLVPELKKQADIVIALVHMGIYDDEVEGRGSKWLARNVDGIDMIIDGHSHTKVLAPIVVNNTPIVQAWQWGLIMGKAVLKIQNMKVIDFQWEPVPINNRTKVKNADGTSTYPVVNIKGEVDASMEFAKDQTLLNMLLPYREKVETVLAEKIGYAEETFEQKDVRKMETAIGDLVADSMLWYTKDLGVDFAIQNGGGIREPIPQGDITKKVIYTSIPFDNSVAVLTIKGSDLKEMFAYLPTIPAGAGAFPQVSDGVSFTINFQTKKCENILVHGQPIDDNKLYKVATNSYMATGGDGYVAFKKAVDYYDTSKFQRDVLIEYIIYLGGKIKPAVYNRITIVGNQAAFLKPAMVTEEIA